MPTNQKKVAVATKRREPRRLARHATPAGRAEKHIGAREDQISVTMPPKADDDEPKQG